MVPVVRIKSNQVQYIVVHYTEDHERGVRLAYTTPIGCHFNDGEHSRLDFRIQIVWLLQHNSQVNRKIIESKFIARLGTLKPAGLNLHP